jgi:uncharacterized membrane protein
MTLDPWLLLVHIAGAIVWIGGGLMLCIIGARLRRSDNLAVISDFARTLSYVGLRLFMPAVLLVLISGIWLVLISSEFTITQLWVLLALGGFVLAFLIGGVYLSRSAIQLERAATQGTDLQPAQEALSRWVTGYVVALVVLALIVVDMVFKPGT